MSYNPVTDFLALLRRVGNSNTELARVPGLDFVVSAMARAGMFTVYVGQTAPTVNQATTVWVLPALPSWTAESTVLLWNAAAGAYQTATAALWVALLSPSQYNFQSQAGASVVVAPQTSLLAIQRAAPAASTVVLPALNARAGSKPLSLVDWSSGVTNHIITLTTPDGATIMRAASWELYSTAAQLASARLQPSTDLDGWVIE